jgi:hypothetical protein
MEARASTPSVIKVKRSSHLRALSDSASARRPLSPPGPPSIGRAAVGSFAGPTLEEVAMLASRAVFALKDEKGSTKGAIKSYIESFYAGDIPDQALTGALRKPVFIEHERGRFRLRVAAVAPNPPVQQHAPAPAPPTGAQPTQPLVARRKRQATHGLEWWRTPVRVTPATPSSATTKNS